MMCSPFDKTVVVSNIHGQPSYIFILIALNEAIILVYVAFHFSMDNNERSCDHGGRNGRANVNVIQ